MRGPELLDRRLEGSRVKDVELEHAARELARVGLHDVRSAQFQKAAHRAPPASALDVVAGPSPRARWPMRAGRWLTR